MASIKLRRGSGLPSGLTFGEPAFDITNSRLYIGITGSSVLVGVAGGGVHSFNGLTGAVTGVTTGTANTFGPLQSFTSGISSSGGTFASQVNFVSGISASGGTFNNDIFVNGVRVGEGGGSISTNVAVGQNALNANTTGSQSVAIGTDAATTGVTVTNITAVGYRSLYLNRADNNTSVGNSSLLANTTGTQNVSIGTSALFSNTTGSFNVGMGHGALNSQIDSTENIAVGRLTLQNLSSGSQNTAIGSQAGRYFGSGTTSATNISNSILIGYDARPLGNTESNQIVIGYQGRGDGSNTTVIGNSSTTSTRVFGQLSTNGGICAAGGTFGSQVNFLSGISASGITVGVARIIGTSLRGGNGFTIRGSTLGSVPHNEIDLPAVANPVTISSATGVINFDSGLASKTVDYSTGIRLLGYNSGLGVATSTTLVNGGGAGNTVSLPLVSGTLALVGSVVTSFNGLTGSVTGVTTGTANTFGPLQSFTSGISSSGGTFSSQVNFVSGISASGGTFGGLVRFTRGLSASGATFGPNVNIGNTAATTNLFLRGSVNFINCPNGYLTIATGQTLSGLNIEDASANNTTIKPTTHEIQFYDNTDGDTVTLNAGLVVGAGPYTVTLPSYETTLAGLVGEQTFTGLKSFSAGISASGGITFNSTIISNGYRYSSSVFDTRTSGFTLSAADAGKIFLIGFCGGSTNIYCPTGLPVGFQCDVIRRQAASQRIRIFQSGTTIESKSGNNPELTNSSNGGEKAKIIQIDTNVYVVYGDI